MKSVIWDMDGVLLDTEPIYLEVEQSIVSRYGKQIETVLPKLLGSRAEDAAEIVVKELELPITPEQFLAERNAQLIDKLPECKIFPGVWETVAHLKKHGVKCAVATSSPAHLLNVKRSGKDPFFILFDAIVCGDDVIKGKPDPEIFLRAAAKIDARPEECIVFEDAPKGVHGAIAAGMKCIALPNSKVDRSMYEKESPTFIVDSAKVTDFDLTQVGLPAMEK